MKRIFLSLILTAATLPWATAALVAGPIRGSCHQTRKSCFCTTETHLRTGLPETL